MRRPDIACAATVLGALFLLSGCADTRDLAPSGPDAPWRPAAASGLKMPSGAAGFAAPYDPEAANAIGNAVGPGAGVGLGGPLDLAALIDMAERHDPHTRIVWEQAREAAIGVGITGAALLPQLTASALGGYQRQALPLPNYLSRRGYLTSNAAAVFPKLELSYLLFDFGQTADRVRAARQMAIAADYGFTAAHQALILAVIRAYYGYDAADASLRAAGDSVKNTAFLLRAAMALRAHGEGTVTDVAIAQRNAAQAVYMRDRATAAQHAAKYALLEAMGLPPTTRLAIRVTEDRPLPATVPGDIQNLIAQTLEDRPDILADVARLRAAREAVDAAKASLAPRIAIAADVQGYIGTLKSRGTYEEAPASSIAQPEAGAFLQMTWPLYEGGLRANTIRLAETREAEAHDTLAKTTLAAERDVATAQDALGTALSQVHSAQVLRDAAHVAFEAASQAYGHGVGTLTDASSASDAFSMAEAQLATAHAQALTDAAALAYATGQLTSAIGGT